MDIKKKILIKDGKLWLDNICLVPIISGRVCFAYEVRETFLNIPFDCITVGLPYSYSSSVLQGIRTLPYISTVIEEGEDETYSFFPIDPCDGIIEAARLAIEESIPIRFIDTEMGYIPQKKLILPDEYSIKGIGLSSYIQSVFSGYIQKKEILSIIGKEDLQAKFMASKLSELSFEFDKILFVFSIHHLPAILDHYLNESKNTLKVKKPAKIKLYSVDPDSLFYILGEIPFFTFHFERLKNTLSSQRFDKTEIIKKILLEARDEYHRDFKKECYTVSLHDIQTTLRFIRNLCCIKKRLTPDLYELVVAAKGIIGNNFTLKLIELAKFYPFLDISPPFPTIKMTDNKIFIKNSTFTAYRKVPSLAKEWKRVKLEKPPGKKLKKYWKTKWNPHAVCSWPPEDEIIENFCGHIRKRPLNLAGISQIRIEEFQGTLKDGIHIKETLRNWHLGKIYIKDEPQIRGEVGAIVFIFDDSLDINEYPYKLTWHAEHENESTMVFYATDFKDDLIGPGIGQSLYGGALFLYPPQYIPDVWTDFRFHKASDNMERLVMAGLYYSQDRYIALVAKERPSLFLREYARAQQKKIIFFPISCLNHKTLQKFRRFHVLNGRKVRNWADRFIY